MLTRVTITGADDEVEPDKLAALSAEFPFAEWGILFSWSRTGTPRYPSDSWIQDLLKEKEEHIDGPTMQLAAHLCGEASRQLLAGANLAAPLISAPFARIQINGYAPPRVSDQFFERAAPAYAGEFILQARHENEIQAVAHDTTKLPRASMLFDPSGGRGVEPFMWPVTPAGTRMGFAGGIKPHRIQEVLGEIGVRDYPFWIDMESGVRDDANHFDLGKVRASLEAAAPFVVDF